jgi:hypothetical protein
LAKSIFQVHGVDASGQVVVRRSLRRAQMMPFFAVQRIGNIASHAILSGLHHQYVRI